MRTSLHQAREQEIVLAARLTQAQADIVTRDHTLHDVQAVLATLHSRVEQLETERRALKASRSWRWTAPLRGLERLFRQPGDRTK